MSATFNQTITMGFVLSILYLVTSYLTPPVLFGQLAVYRVEFILAILILIISILKLKGSIILKASQSLAVIGLAFAGSLSVLFGMHWVKGAVQAFPAFLPCAYAYFLVCLNCNSKKKLQVIVLMLLFVCLFIIARGYYDLRHGVPQSGPVQSETTESDNSYLWDMEHPYLLEMKNDAGESCYRLL
jgi:hypothetical protein